LTVANQGKIPTYVRVNAQSVIDVTFTRLMRSTCIRGWHVLHDLESASDHRYLEFTMNQVQDEAGIKTANLHGWSHKKLSSDKLQDYLRTSTPPIVTTETDGDQAADLLAEYLRKACDSCMPARSSPP
jgi:hypothetical protein